MSIRVALALLVLAYIALVFLLLTSGSSLRCDRGFALAQTADGRDICVIVPTRAPGYLYHLPNPSF
jgi:hypothetical protein